MHVGWLGWLLFHLFRLFHCPTVPSKILVASGIFFYASIVGFQASISRSLWVFVLFLAGQLLVRCSSPVNLVLASAFLLLCACPDWLGDIGFQLSFVSVSAICLTALPAIENGLKPLLLPLVHAGDPRRLFAQPGCYYRWGRRLRILCELCAEACADGWRPAGERILLATVRTGAKMGMAVGNMLIVTISIQFWLEPLLAYHFNRLSWIAPLANLIVVPMSSLLLAAAAIAASAGDIRGLHAIPFECARWMAGLFLHTTQWIAQIPGAWQRCPTPALAWVMAGMLAMFGWSFFKWRRPWLPCLFVIMVLTLLATGWGPGRDPHLLEVEGKPAAGSFSFTFLDVGEGDSIIIRFPDGGTWVLDAGGLRVSASGDDATASFDIGESVVSRYLWSCWKTRLERLVLSHPDRDHAGGMLSLMKNFRIGQFDYGEKRAEAMLTRIQAAARARKIITHLRQAGDHETHAGVQVRVLNPVDHDVPPSTNENSLVLHFTHGRFSALLTGDLEKSAEADLISRNPEIRGLLLKVAHHGSRSSSSEYFLRHVRPLWGVVSVGKGNAFGHPSPEVLQRLTLHGVRTLLTTDQGAITFETDGNRYVLSSYTGGILEQGLLPQEP